MVGTVSALRLVNSVKIALRAVGRIVVLQEITVEDLQSAKSSRVGIWLVFVFILVRVEATMWGRVELDCVRFGVGIHVGGCMDVLEAVFLPTLAGHDAHHGSGSGNATVRQ